MCGRAKIPDKYVAECYEEYHNRLNKHYSNGSGIPSDGYVLLVDAVNAKSCYSGAAASALSCLMDQETDRGKRFIPFCNKIREATCRDAFSYGACSIRKYLIEVPKEDRFFKVAPFATKYDAKYFGGVDSFKDYCPTLGYVKGLSVDYKATSFCTHEENVKLSRKHILLLLLNAH
ncbi:unnamed protein product [Schistosoma turkestanicum]|nr:unnamed protein product [Schistosoma turkestanicum]